MFRRLVSLLRNELNLRNSHGLFYRFALLTATLFSPFIETKFPGRHKEHHQEELGQVAESSRQRNQNTQGADGAAS